MYGRVESETSTIEGSERNRGRVAVLIPCYNEELTVGKVVGDFRLALPEADIYVFDNNSQDRTAEIAKAAGATVVHEKRKGKGYVVQAMFRKVNAQYYVMVDGDDTYPAEHVGELLDVVRQDRADMAVANRLTVHEKKAFRPLHVFGNNLVRWLVNMLFGANLRDIMSGYRAMKYDVVNGITVLSPGFEVETEMTLQCLNNGFLIEEIDLPYGERPVGSASKLSTFRDGYKVLKSIMLIFRDYRPFLFFSILAASFFLAGIAAGSVVVTEFISTRYITHVPLAILATGFILLSVLMLGIGLILDSMRSRFNEIYWYIKNRMTGQREQPESPPQ
jgi:glycosyltransferase involved in cell wall biosynthesis